MAKPIANNIRLPVDTGNLGKMVRTQTRVIGGDTVHEHYFVRARQAELLGVYCAVSSQLTVQAAAQNGTSTGFIWTHVPVAATNKAVRLRRVTLSTQHSTVLATPTAPRLLMSRFTFTGTASGASLASAKMLSSYPASNLDLRTASTGLTVSLSGNVGVGGIVGALTAVGAYAPSQINLLHDQNEEDEWPTILPGEGIVFWQDVAGTTADTRKMNVSLVWDEIDTQ